MYYNKRTWFWKLNRRISKNIDIGQSKFRWDPGLNIFSILSNLCLSCKRLTRATAKRNNRGPLLLYNRVGTIRNPQCPGWIFLNGIKQQTINQMLQSVIVGLNYVVVSQVMVTSIIFIWRDVLWYSVVRLSVQTLLAEPLAPGSYNLVDKRKMIVRGQGQSIT